jgi:serine/threonine-protein kinase RsbW
VPEGLPSALTIRVPSHLEFVRPVRKMVEALLLGQAWGEEATADAGLVVTELIQNAVEHGSRGDGAEQVDVLVLVESGAVLFEVSDPGTGKGPQSLLAQDVVHPPPADAPRGRGLFLVNRMVQALERGRTPGGGSVVRIRLRVEAPVP